MKIVGIDPGLSGALACIGRQTLLVRPMPVIKLTKGQDLDGAEIKNFLIMEQPNLVVIEQVNAMPGQGVTSMFNFGKSFGRLMGICEGLEIPYELVRPQAWKKSMGIGGDKSSAIQKAKQLFPAVSLLPTPRCKKDHDGMAEALLLAEYGRRFL